MKRKSSEMYPMIERYYESGLARKSFCTKHELSMPVFQYWLAKYESDRENRKIENDFKAIEIKTIKSDQCIEIKTSRGIHISIPL